MEFVLKKVHGFQPNFIDVYTICIYNKGIEIEGVYPFIYTINNF